VTKWTRTQNSRLLYEAGIGIYDQEYTELYQPGVLSSNSDVFDLNSIGQSNVYSITEQNTGKVFNAYNSPADHFSLLRTYNGAVSYVTGAHAFRFGGTLSEGNRRLVQRYTGDLTMTFRGGLPQSVTLRTPLDQRDGIRNDLGLYAQDRWTLAVQRSTPGCAMTGSLVKCWTRRCRPAAGTRQPTSAASPSRTGRTCRRASACPTTCSATARRR